MLLGRWLMGGATAAAIGLLMITVFQANAASFQRGELSCSDIEFLLKRQVSSKRIIELITERKSSCRVNREMLDGYEKAGASKDLLAAIERGGVGKSPEIDWAATKEPPRPTPTINVEAWTNKGENAVYSEGENIVVNVRANQNAYVRVYYTDAGRQTLRIYPNTNHAEARIPARTVLTIPSRGDNFRIQVAPPFGAEMISVLVSERSLKSLLENGSAAEPFVLLPDIPSVGSDVVVRQIRLTTKARTK